GEPDVARVHDHRLAHQIVLTAVFVLGVGRPYACGVDEVGDHPHLRRVPPSTPAAPDLSDDVVLQVVGEDGDGVGGQVALTLQQRRGLDHLLAAEGADLDGRI